LGAHRRGPKPDSLRRFALIRRRLVAVSSFALATGLGITSLTETSASLAAAAPDRVSGPAQQRVLVHSLQVEARARQEQQARAEAQAAAEAARRAAEARPPVRAVKAPVRHRPRIPVDWEALVARYPWDVSVAGHILWCESRGDANAENSGHNGLFQIAGGPFDPVANVALAYEMYQARGWQPWYSSSSCWS
jgi:hypothetical protein